MNNMKYYRDNLAHDYDMFMPKEKPQNPEKIIPMPKNREKSSNKTSAIAKSKVFTVAIGAFIVLAFFANIFLRAEISKVGSQINAAEVTGNQLKSEQVRLNVELEKKTSIGNLEKQAKELGMQKQEKAQINYIFSYDDGVTEESAQVE